MWVAMRQVGNCLIALPPCHSAPFSPFCSFTVGGAFGKKFPSILPHTKKLSISGQMIHVLRCSFSTFNLDLLLPLTSLPRCHGNSRSDHLQNALPAGVNTQCLPCSGLPVHSQQQGNERCRELFTGKQVRCCESPCCHMAVYLGTANTIHP